MATRRKSSPYAMSANLGSGVRTTTGGSYTNPRLGIQDYTAFGRGVASTFRVPEQEEGEVKQLEGGIDYFGAQKDAFLGDIEFKENRLLVDKFTNGPLAQMQAQYEKCSKANDRRCLQNISNDLGIYQTGQSQFKRLLEYADGEIMDPETSKGRFLIDVNGNQIMGPNNKPIEISDLRKVNNESPQDMVLGIALNKNGEKKAVYQFQMDGKTYTTNLTDLNEQFLNNNFDVRSDIGLNVQRAMTKDGSTFGWKDDPKMLEGSTNITTDKGDFQASTFEGYEKIVNDKQYFDDASTAANTFSSNLYKTSSSPGNNSAFNALAKRLYNDDFISNVEGYTKPNAKDETAFINELKALPNDVKLAMLRDEGTEEWKIKNASKGHRRGGEKDFDEDGNSMLGRALPLDEKLITSEKYTEKPITEGETSFTPEDTTKLASQIKSYFTEGVLGEDRKRLIDKSIKIPGFKEGVITNVTGSAGSLNIEYIDADFEKFEDDAGEPIKKSKTYDLRSVEDLLEHTNYLSLPLLKGQSNAKNRDSLLKELNK